MRLFTMLLVVMLLLGCNAANEVAQIGHGIVDPSGVRNAVGIGDSRLKVLSEMGHPDRRLVTQSGRTEAMVYTRGDAEGLVLLDPRTDRVLRVLTADAG